MIETADSKLVGALHPSPNIEPRRNNAKPDLILLHYTGMLSGAKAIDWLARPESRVSCHYVVDTDGAITQMVAEDMRAWHAGVAHWAGCDDINSCSIGIEIQNPGHELGYPDFPPEQMFAVAALSRDIATRWRIDPTRILAHSDIAPLRKIDPGEKFDWAFLAAEGVGYWIAPTTLDPSDAGAAPRSSGAMIAEAQSLLAAYGYGIGQTGGLDRETEFVVRAFQRHFRPARVDGHIDHSTLDTLRRLVRGCAPHAA